MVFRAVNFAATFITAETDLNSTVMVLNDTLIQQVWEKGISFAPETENHWRKDVYFSFIKREDFNNFDSEYGWGIEKIENEKGTEIANLRPVQWRNLKNPLLPFEEKVCLGY